MTTKYKLDRETLELLTNASQMLSYFGSTYKMIPITKLKAFDKDQIIGQDMEFTSWLNDLAEIGNKLLEASPAQESEPVAEPMVELWQALGKWSAYLTSSPTCLADLAPPDYLIKAINNATAHPPADKDAKKYKGNFDESSSVPFRDYRPNGD